MKIILDTEDLAELIRASIAQKFDGCQISDITLDIGDTESQPLDLLQGVIINIK